MGGFVFVQYSGNDAASLLATILRDDEPDGPFEITSTPQHQRVGFQPNPDDESDEEEDVEDEPDSD